LASKDTPDSLEARVGRLETAVAEIRTDIRWIKTLITPTFFVSLISLLLMIAKMGMGG